ncbi:MAG TPA: hypothetical protein VH560_10875 [Polyangia bacterium]|nr:hypothetical protein [Polyangia bacterium]
MKLHLKSSFVSSTFLAVVASSFVACSVNHDGLGGVTMPFLHTDGGAGATGSAGAGATAGASGAAGDTSLGGSSGAAGDVGTAGSTDTAGTTGTAGDLGSAGDLGTAGAGTAGANGTAGDVGTAGATGTAGIAGTAGAGTAGAGTAGVVGTAGAGGTAGMTGTAGASGTAGAPPPPPCNANTCKTGCCSQGICITNQSDAHCGANGAACTTCGSCQLCSDAGACTVDPSSTWHVFCGQATIAMSPPGGGTWDPHSASGDGTQPDPFCEFEMPAHQVSATTAAVSATLPDTFTPVWNADITPQKKGIKASDLMSTAKTWRLWVGDADGCCAGQEICELDQPLPAAALLTGQASYQNLMSCLSLSLKFVCEP